MSSTFKYHLHFHIDLLQIVPSKTHSFLEVAHPYQNEDAGGDRGRWEKRKEVTIERVGRGMNGVVLASDREQGGE